MATLIDAEKLNLLIRDDPEISGKMYARMKMHINEAPAVDAVVVPCKIGDRVWTIRNHRGFLIPHEGIVSEIFFCHGMQLCIVVKNIARGEWGKTIFATKEEAEAAIEERRKSQC